MIIDTKTPIIKLEHFETNVSKYNIISQTGFQTDKTS